jgi:hypothetical protein
MNKQRKKLVSLLIFLVFSLFFILSFQVLAQQIVPSEFEQTVNLPKGPPGGLPEIIARIIRVALGFLGIVAIVVILYGGFVWMTSGGDEEKIRRAKKTLINGTIGLGLILGAFIIVQFIFRAFLGEEEVPLAAPPAVPSRVGGGALGSGIIESHYPFRGQTGVPRNTKIVITFKEAIDPASIADSSVNDDSINNVCTGNNSGATSKYVKDGKVFYCEVGGNKKFVQGLTLKTNAIQIIKTKDIKDSVRESPTSSYVAATVSFTSDLRTFVLTPQELLGSPTENVSYTVYICGSKLDGNCKEGGIRLFNSGQSAFKGRFQDYEWSFETGTFLDLTPPTITSIVPIWDNEQDGPNGEQNDRKDKPRNTLIQINFSEPILPTVASGKTVTDPQPPATGSGGTYKGGKLTTATFQILKVSADNGTTYLAGEWQIGNQYKTTEFTSADKCGKNACGQDVFCLPGPAQIMVQAQSASLANPSDPKSFVSAGLMDGIEDLAGNALDGDKDGVADGPGSYYNLNETTKDKGEPGNGDSVQWSFYTLPSIDLTSPQIYSTNPAIEAQGVTLTQPIEMTFNKPMSITTLNSRNIDLAGFEASTSKPWDTWWMVGAENIDENLDQEPEKTKAIITHGGFWELSNYQCQANQDVKDIYQNCFYPSGGAKCQPGDTLPCSQVCGATPEKPYCCNGQPCGKNDEYCNKECGFK